jgi:hypothetical protein
VGRGRRSKVLSARAIRSWLRRSWALTKKTLWPMRQARWPRAWAMCELPTPVAALDEVAGGEVDDLRLRDLRVEGEVEGFQRSLVLEARLADPGRELPLIPALEVAPTIRGAELGVDPDPGASEDRRIRVADPRSSRTTSGIRSAATPPICAVCLADPVRYRAAIPLRRV